MDNLNFEFAKYVSIDHLQLQVLIQCEFELESMLQFELNSLLLEGLITGKRYNNTKCK